MIGYVFLDAAGFVIGGGSNRVLPQGAEVLPKGITAMAARQMMQVDGVLVTRPALPLPEVSVFEITGRTVRFAGLPTGTVAATDDTLARYRMAVLPEVDGVITIDLPDPLYIPNRGHPAAPVSA